MHLHTSSYFFIFQYKISLSGENEHSLSSTKFHFQRISNFHFPVQKIIFQRKLNFQFPLKKHFPGKIYFHFHFPEQNFTFREKLTFTFQYKISLSGKICFNFPVKNWLSGKNLLSLSSTTFHFQGKINFHFPVHIVYYTILL